MLVHIPPLNLGYRHMRKNYLRRLFKWTVEAKLLFWESNQLQFLSPSPILPNYFWKLKHTAENDSSHKKGYFGDKLCDNEAAQ